MLDSIKAKVKVFLNETCFQMTMTLVTLYALLGDDLRLIFVPIESDGVFTSLTIFSLILFTLELVLASISQEDYLNSFFFWLDLVSTASLITDIEPIMNALMTIGESDGDGSSNLIIQDDNTASLARASRGARLGTKAGRMTRIIRLI